MVAAISANFSRPQVGLKIAGSDIQGIRGFNGWVDEVAIYGKVLTSERIRQHYYFGTNDQQLVVVNVNGHDRRGIGITPNVCPK